MPHELAVVLAQVLGAVKWVVIAAVIASWVLPDPENPIRRFLDSLTDPMLKPLRPYLTVGMIDLSPIAVFFALGMLQRLVLGWG